MCSRVVTLLPSNVEKPLFQNVVENIVGKCLVGTGNCYDCGKSGHIKRHFPIMKTKGRENVQAQSISRIWMLLKRIYFMLSNLMVIKRSHEIWLPFCYNYFPLMYVFSCPKATLSFVTPLVDMKFEILPDILEEPSVTTMVGDSVVVKRVCKGCPIFLPNCNIPEIVLA